jgi:hypothetical protein
MVMDQREESPLGEKNNLDSETVQTLFQAWLSVLELSCMWQMDKVRERADEEIWKLSYRLSEKDLIYLLTLLDKLGISETRDRYITRLSQDLRPVKLIRIGKELPVYSFLLNGYAGLVMQESGILTEHEELLGMKTTSKLFRIRDGYLQKQRRSGSINYSMTNKDSIMRELKQLCAEELKETLWISSN